MKRKLNWYLKDVKEGKTRNEVRVEGGGKRLMERVEEKEGIVMSLRVRS